VNLEVDREHRVIDWVGGLPDRWEVHSLGSQLAENRSSNKGMIESRVLSLSYGSVIVKPEEKLRGLVPESFETYQIVEPGDIVIRPTDLQNDQTSLRVGQSRYRGIITSAYICLRPTASLNHRYAAFLLSGYDHMKVFYGFGSGLRQNLDVKHIKHIPVPVPSLEEQELIVRYLDHAELRIAKAIAAKTRLLRLLTEQKQVIVEELVLRGGSRTNALRDSGQAWMGPIPSHWEVVPSKSLFGHRRERARPGDEMLTASQSLGIINRDEFMEREGRRVMVVQSGSDMLKHVEPNDFVISMRSFQGGLEWSKVRGKISSAYVMLPPAERIHCPYFAFLLKSTSYISALRATSDLVRDGQALRYSNFCQIQLPLPPVVEQEEIANQVEARTHSISASMISISREIALLKEYRTRLISDVVTGKLDVRAEAAKLPVIDPEELADVTAGAGLTAEDDGDDE
jgi:type I restriction enzyme S subunit